MGDSESLSSKRGEEFMTLSWFLSLCVFLFSRYWRSYLSIDMRTLIFLCGIFLFVCLMHGKFTILGFPVNDLDFRGTFNWPIQIIRCKNSTNKRKDEIDSLRGCSNSQTVLMQHIFGYILRCVLCGPIKIGLSHPYSAFSFSFLNLPFWGTSDS